MVKSYLNKISQQIEMKIFHVQTHSPYDHNIQGLSRPKAGAHNSSQVAHVGGRSPRTTAPSSVFFPATLAGSYTESKAAWNL